MATTITLTELERLDGVLSNVQTQLDNKLGNSRQTNFDSAFTAVSPGIGTTVSGNGEFKKASSTLLHVNTASFQIDWTETSFDAAAAFPNLIATHSSQGIDIYRWTDSGTPKLDVFMKATDNTTVTASFTLTDIVYGKVQAYSLVATRTNNIELFIDTVSQGVVDISSLSGKDIPTDETVLMNDGGQSGPYFTSIFDFKFYIGGVLTAHWLMDETSGNIVDVVNSETLIAAGTFVYGVLPTKDISSDGSAFIVSVDNFTPRTITLSSADLALGSVANAWVVVVKDEAGTASTLNNITIDTQGSEKIDGLDSKSISSDFGSLRLYSNGTNWFTF